MNGEAGHDADRILIPGFAVAVGRQGPKRWVSSVKAGLYRPDGRRSTGRIRPVRDAVTMTGSRR